MTTAASSPVNALADWYWDEFLEQQPLWATMLGDERWGDQLDDPSPAGREREVSTLQELLRRADELDVPEADIEDRITVDLLRVVARTRLEYHEHRLWQFDGVDPLNGPQILPGDLARFQRVDTPERIERLIGRLGRYPQYVSDVAANLREGRGAGRTQARAVTQRAITQVRRAVETPTDQSPLIAAHPELAATDRDRLAAAVDRYVRPALGSFLEELEAYLPDAREGDGLCWLPDGDAVYRYEILHSTTLDETAEALHEFGLQQLDAIDEERNAIARELGFSDVAAYRDMLDAEPTNRVRDPSALVRLAERQVARAEAAAPRWFGRLPRAACEVRPVEPHQEQEAPPAFYFPPASDGSRPGIYYINTFEPESRPIHRIASWTYHEAVPGHHFQIAIAGELEAMPDFRRHGARLAGAAYTEGWGLYSERLADEMGLYEDPRERFGMLDGQAWRAARLVVDTGMHAFRWDRQQSIDLLTRRVGLSQLVAETETDRYIGWPGQALSYMTGQREIQALRRTLEARDGASFDLRAFHDELLAHGSLPLATLRSKLPGWLPAAPPSSR
jgi:uncharacterized protein (DUF885 family)